MDNDNKAADNQQEIEEIDLGSLANSLLGKEEEKKDDENKGEEQAKPDAEAEKKVEEDKSAEDKVVEEDKKVEDKKSADNKDAEKPAEGDKPDVDKTESEPTKEDKPLTRDEIKEVLREEAEERATVSSQRATYAGQVRSDLKEALKPESTYTDITLDDGTPITSVSQLTQIINPETEEPYTREEASTLLLDARKIVDENVAAYEKRVDELTDLNVNFKEQADEVDRLYGDILKAFPEEAKGWLEAYQKTFTLSKDGTYVENVPISPLEFYKPILAPYRNATDQVIQRQVDEKAAEEKAAKDAEIKAEQEDRGDLSSTAGDAKGKPNPLAEALDKYIDNN